MKWKKYSPIGTHICKMPLHRIRTVVIAIVLALLVLNGCDALKVDEKELPASIKTSSKLLSSTSESSSVSRNSSNKDYAELELTNTDDYILYVYSEYGVGTHYEICSKSYRLADVTDEENFSAILDLIDKIAPFTDVGDNKFTPGESVEMGNNLISRTAMESQEGMVVYDTPLFNEWALQYPATEDYYGPASAYLPGSYLRQTKEKYYCKNCENIALEEAEYYYNTEQDVYSIIFTGNEVATMPILHSIEETNTQITAIFSFLNYVSASDGELFDRDGGDIKGCFKLVELILPECGKVTFAEPYVPPENRASLRKIKFTFCREGDSLKVHRLDYVE